ncbi:MAG: N-acetylmuramoyl-L-alanine amidase [Cyanobacteria bacterium SIG31]|nr:N-acetylmuramoyl-L-alanine amidase [Cyanobacteria bacterium SIG31]
MKRIFFLITLFIFSMHFLLLPVFANIEPVKIMSLNYDDSSSLIYISTRDNMPEQRTYITPKLVRLTNPNRVYFDINDAVLIGEKQQLVFEKSNIKELRLAQFETNPNIVRAVMTFEEDFDTSKVKIMSINGNIIIKTSNLALNNDYFNVVYDDKPTSQVYNGIVANSQFVQKVEIPASNQIKAPENVMDDIQRAFEVSTLPNTNGKTYDSVVSVDLSTNLKLRTKYFINQYLPKNGGLLVSGLGQLTTAKRFSLKDPERVVIDLPNTFLDRSVRNKEIKLCPDDSCSDVAKIGQFEHNIARIVVTSDKAEKYLPIYSQDSQSLFLIDTDKLNHTSLVSNVSNLNKAFVRRIDPKTNELILSFTSPVVHSILRTDNSLNLFLFNVQSYNEQDLLKTLANSYYKQLAISLLPKIGVKAGIEINKSDVVRVEQSIDAKALKITITRGTIEEIRAPKPPKKGLSKNKIMLDAGHGGSDYGAIREGINEKDITLEITQRVDAILRSKGYKTALVRDDDSFVSLEDRAAFNESEDPEIFVSIHVNSAVSKDPSGIETHWYHENSKDLAQIIHKHMVKNIPTSIDRGLFKSKFYVINHTKAPAVLCEIGFLSNDAERNALITESRKQKTAKAIADGIIEYLKRYK